MSIASIVAWLWLAAQQQALPTICTLSLNCPSVKACDDLLAEQKKAGCFFVNDGMTNNTITLTQPPPYYLFLRYPAESPKVGQIMVPCGKPHKDANGDSIQDYCWVYPKTKRRERGQ